MFMSLLKIDCNIDRLIRMNIFNKFAENATNKFDSIQKELKQESFEDKN